MVAIKTFDDYLSMWNFLSERDNFGVGFNFYITQGPEFRRRARGNGKLRRVYGFLKRNVFDGVEYGDLKPSEQYEAMLELYRSNRKLRMRGFERNLTELIEKEKAREAYEGN